MFWVTRGGDEAQPEQYLISTSEISLTNTVREQVLAADALPIKLTAHTPVLPLRGRQRRPRHARHDPPAPVRQGRDGADRPSRARATRRSRRWSATPRRSCRSSACRIGWCCCAPATWASARPRPTTSRSGCRRRTPTARSARARTAKPSRRGACRRASRTRRARTSSCTPSTARAWRSAATLVAVLENCQNADGSIAIPEALRPYLGGVERAAAMSARSATARWRASCSRRSMAPRLVPLLSERDAAFDLSEAFATADALRAAAHRARRAAAGLQDRLHQPQHLGPLRRARADLGPGVGHARSSSWRAAKRGSRWRRSRQPRLEPEIMFGFARAPRAGMIDGRARRLHRLGRARLRDRAHALRPTGASRPPTRWPTSRCTAACSSARGCRSPRSPTRPRELAALHVDLLERRQGHRRGRRPPSCSTARCTRCASGSTRWRRNAEQWPIVAGDIVTTGTITDAWPLRPGQRWRDAAERSAPSRPGADHARLSRWSSVD